MEIQPQKVPVLFSRSKAARSARNRLQRPSSNYKSTPSNTHSIASSSTIFSPERPFRGRNLYDSQVNYLLTRAESARFTSLPSTCWCLFDQNNNTELGFRKGHQREIASLTKIMTTFLALELKNKHKISPNTLIRVTETAVKNAGTTAGLKVNNWVFLKDLFYGIMLPSGNDAAHLMAEFMGSVLVRSRRDDSFNAEKLGLVDLTRETQFVRQMNWRAEQLGLSATRFSNPHGLQNAMNISTARDVLTLSLHAAKDPRFRAIMNAEVHRYHQYSGDQSHATKTVRVWENTNVLLREGWEGIKTGQTQAAGGCLSSLREGVYIVVLNCPDSLKRFTQTKRLYEWYMTKGRDQRNTASSECFQM